MKSNKSDKSSALSNSYSTGGAGHHFEAHVQAYFLISMMVKGSAPCIREWPISEIKLQGKVLGYDTDDIIVKAKKLNGTETSKLLCQVKRDITSSNKNKEFAATIKSAWRDYSNQKLFNKGFDKIALITGPLSKKEWKILNWIVEQARSTSDDQEFFLKVEQANFSPKDTKQRIQTIRDHIQVVKGVDPLMDDEYFQFLKHFHVLSFDLGNETGMILSTLFTVLTQLNDNIPRLTWSRATDIVQNWGQNAGTLTTKNVPADFIDLFKRQERVQRPEKFQELQSSTGLTKLKSVEPKIELAYAGILGSWDENNEHDKKLIGELVNEEYNRWIVKLREYHETPQDLIEVSNGVWRCKNREKALQLYGKQIHDIQLKGILKAVLNVLKERDPKFDLPPKERFAAEIYNKRLQQSNFIRTGLAEIFSIVANRSNYFANCNPNIINEISAQMMRELFVNASWEEWAGLNSFLPLISEADPDEFLNQVENALGKKPSPFDEVYKQEGNGITEQTYISGLLWALEGIAWDKEYLVRSCVVLAELASIDPDGPWQNRPINSIITILLPWLPQTIGSIEKRNVAVTTICREYPNLGWKVLMQLMPDMNRTSSGSHKPTWLKSIPGDWKKGETRSNYLLQISNYAQLLISQSRNDVEKLAELSSQLQIFPEKYFKEFLKGLSSEQVLSLSEIEKSKIWDSLISFVIKHRRFSQAEWAFPEKALKIIERAAIKLEPVDSVAKYHRYFSARNPDLIEEKGGWEIQEQKLNSVRKEGIRSILKAGGWTAFKEFIAFIEMPYYAGIAAGSDDKFTLDEEVFDEYLGTGNKMGSEFMSGYVWSRYRTKSLDWLEQINWKKWSKEQLISFLCFLPFNQTTWNYVQKWLKDNEIEYWKKVNPDPYRAEEDIEFAVRKLQTVDRPFASIDCIYVMLIKKMDPGIEVCVKSLQSALKSEESLNHSRAYEIVELFKYLQQGNMDFETLSNLEWSYLSVLDRHSGGAPITLEKRLSVDPDFFCEILKILYKSTEKAEDLPFTSEKREELAKNAWRLFSEWRRPPGLLDDNSFDGKAFANWISKVESICKKSGHLQVAQITIGSVLIHCPADINGLWIHSSVAEVLNLKTEDKLRAGFSSGIMNSRGVHFVDPDAKPEKELSIKYNEMSDQLENAGYHRLAVTLKNISRTYSDMASRIVEQNRKGG